MSEHLGSTGHVAAEFEIGRLQKCCDDYRATIARLTAGRDRLREVLIDCDRYIVRRMIGATASNHGTINSNELLSRVRAALKETADD